MSESAVVATVGTTHPLAFAGLEFAVLALASAGVRPACVVAGVSAQDAGTVLTRTPLDGATIAAQFHALRGAGVAVFHVGALLSRDVVVAVTEGLATYPGVPVVLDPVLAATGGGMLGDDETFAALRALLLPRATLVTPNLAEAGALVGQPVRDLATMRAAARALIGYGASAALVKGGHLVGNAIDVLADATDVHELRGARIAGDLRGTGDLLAVSVAAALANGLTLLDAVDGARARVRAAIAAGVPFAGTRVAAMSALGADSR